MNDVDPQVAEAVKPAPEYILGRDFNTGQKDHAIAQDAPYLTARNTRFYGYKAAYIALCGREVWQYTTVRSVLSNPWDPEGPYNCKACQKKVRALADLPDAGR